MAFASLGQIQIFPKKAKLTHDTEFFGKMDPYCVFILGEQKEASQVHKNGGKFPVWKDMITLHRQTEEILVLQVWDKDLTKNDLVGETEIIISTLFEDKKIEKWYTINYKGKNAGSVLLELIWIPEEQKDQQFKKSQTMINQPHQNIYQKAQTLMLNSQSQRINQQSENQYTPQQIPPQKIFPIDNLQQQSQQQENQESQSQPQSQQFSSAPQYPGQVYNLQNQPQEPIPQQQFNLNQQVPNQFPNYQMPQQQPYYAATSLYPQQIYQHGQDNTPYQQINPDQQPSNQYFSSAPQYPGQYQKSQTQFYDNVLPPQQGAYNQPYNLGNNPQSYQSVPPYQSQPPNRFSNPVYNQQAYPNQYNQFTNNQFQQNPNPGQQPDNQQYGN